MNSTLPVDQVICGDNVQVISEWPDECIDMFLTSPPYDNLRTYNGFEWDFDLLADQLWRVMKPGAVGVWVVGDATINGSETGSSFRQALGFMERGFNIETMIYEKDGVGAAGSMNYYLQAFEYMFVFSKGKPKTFNVIRDRKNTRPGEMVGARRKGGDVQKKFKARVGNTGRRFNIWKYSGGRMVTSTDDIAFCHPAIFPEQLARDHIISWSNPGDVVLDPFFGSGTTGKMATLTGRHYIGIDISPDYCRLAEKRIAAVQQQPRLFAWDMTPAI